ncbi:hypothetical protein OF83DRAFT_757991 [Amylostereum chailletii]|nr:hypothetical protein OF83DRAFT_757991 [Amylostereum chailletii]
MTYWESPEVLLRDYAAVIKVNHTMAGVVISEVLTTISYELGLFTKRRTYRWTIWIHLFCRVASLLAFLFIMAHDYTIEKTKCQAYSTTLFVRQRSQHCCPRCSRSIATLSLSRFSLV